MTIDERLEAVTMNLELLSRDREQDQRRIDALLTAKEKDAANIRALARIAEIHEHRLADIAGGPSQ